MKNEAAGATEQCAGRGAGRYAVGRQILYYSHLSGVVGLAWIFLPPDFYLDFQKRDQKVTALFDCSR
jgi:hypothetical protein